MTPEGHCGKADGGLKLPKCLGISQQQAVDLNPGRMRERGGKFHNRLRGQGFAAHSGAQGSYQIAQ